MKIFRRHIIALVLFSVFNLYYSNSLAQSEGVSTGKKAVDEWVAEGDQHYRMGNYDVAVDYYGMALGAGFASADLYYNLGNAYYRIGQMGPAILNYERALRLKPSMSDAKENLALAESKTVDRITQLPKLFLVRWIDALCVGISPALWRVIWLVLLALVGAAVVAFRLGRNRAIRKAGLIVGAVLVLLIVVSSLLMLSSTRRYNAHKEAVVMSQSMTVKSSPEEQSVDKLILHEGTKVVVSDSLSGWYKITLADGTTGWCIPADVERI